MSIVSLFLGLICGLLLMFCSHFPGAGKCQLIWGTDEQLSKAILEMLHISKLSIPLRTKPHHYMKLVYHLRNPLALNSEGTLVQSFRSIQDPDFGIPGWLWFNISYLKPSMRLAELVLLRKILHPESLTVNVTVHSISVVQGNLTESEALDEKVLTLDELPPSGYDVFNISAIFNTTTSDVIGFQLRFTDDSGSLVLHEALTKSLYCLNRCTQSEPLLVAYRFLVTELYGGSKQQVIRECKHCATERRRNLPEDSRLRQCSLHQHYVNFQTMQLSHWIVEPPGFFTSFCKGECSDEEFGELSEAQRGVINKTENWMSSHCVPQKRSSINVMYLSQSEDFVIERLKDLQVESCACNQMF
ncbi:bone morphogenetic protein 7-like [Gopherus evgoodei]|uniref:bone morphogenetic protein 7-like n=1 Tax=Gopherus evgoodei TaxID=1825980 RepID=UPI0011CFA5D2|nr:bone morphogenetic protein 7-like [Gopherus evgoodei]